MKRLAWIAAVVLMSFAASAESTDPRVEQANALLGDASRYPEAIELYRAVLADDPDAHDVRHRLARVLSWSRRYDECFAEYDTLLALPEPPADAAVEKGEVFSWAGRYEEAEAVFQAILAEEPANARAARGLARVYSWSGRRGHAAEAYERALLIEADDDARREFEAIREGYRPEIGSDTKTLSDNDGFRRFVTSVEGVFAIDWQTKIAPRAAYIEVDSVRAGVPDDRGYEVGVSLRRQIGERMRGEFAVGGRFWEEYTSRAFVSAQLGYTTENRTSLTFIVDHRDALDRTDSAAAAEAGILDTDGRLTAWRAWGDHFETFGAIGGSYLSDDNARHRAEGSISWRPWLDHHLRLHLGLGYYGYGKGSSLYYAPSVDANTRVAVTHRLHLPWGFSIDLEAGGGVGIAREGGESNSGGSYDVAGGLAWARGPLRVSLNAGRSQSVRQRSYITERYGAQVGLDF